MRKTRKSPQDKKALSLKRDRRNNYGQNDKAARKAIPANKARERRQSRHKNKLALGQGVRLDEAALDLAESSARHDVARVGGWTKVPDDALGDVIAWARQARVQREGRKWRTRKMRLQSGQVPGPDVGTGFGTGGAVPHSVSDP